MPVRGESSIVPESTYSSPPSPAIDAIKRSTRTYGRPRPTDTDADGLDSVLSSAQSLRLSTSIYKTGPRDDDEEIPQTSDASQSIDAEEESPSPEYRFSWKAKLQEIDEQDEFDLTARGGPSNARVELISDADSLLQKSDNEVPSSAVSGDNGQALATNTSVSTSPISYSSSSHRSPPLTPSLHSVPRRRTKRSRQVTEGKNEDAFLTSSPSPQVNVTTPNLRSSPTPPTSDDEMPMNMLSDTKGKAKTTTLSSSNALPHEFSANTQAHGSAQKKTRSKKRRIKAPTKKELAETAKDRVRIAAEQQILIPRARTEEATSRYTVSNLFASLRPPPLDSEADPIMDFSSDAAILLQENNNVALAAPMLGSSSPKPVSKDLSSSNDPQLDSDKESEDMELPEVGKLLVQEREELSLERKLRELTETKKRLLAANVLNHNDQVEDLEIIPMPHGMEISMKEEDMKRKSGQKRHISEGRKRQLKFGGLGLTNSKTQLLDAQPELQSYGVDYSLNKGKVHGIPVTQAELNKIMATRAEDQRREIIRHKEEEWKRRGGKVKDGNVDPMASMQEATKKYVQRGLSLPQKSNTAVDTNHEQSDEEWVPRENAEEELLPNSSQTAASDDERNVESAGYELGDGDITMVNEGDSNAGTGDEDEDGASIVKLPAKHRMSRKRIVESDSEAEECKEAVTIAQTQHAKGVDEPALSSLHRGSVSSMDGGATEDSDDGDKENKTSRMWDRSEDKENTVVVQHTVVNASVPFLDSGGRSKEHFMSPLTSPSPNEPPFEGTLVENRRPFGDLLDQDALTSPLRSNVSDSFEARLRRSLPNTPALSGAPGPFGLNLTGKSCDTLQFSRGEVKQSPAPKPLRPSFSDLFSPSTEEQRETPSRQLGGDPSNSPKGVPGRTASADTLGLTQDIALQPAFRISGNLLRKADAIFDKEQELQLDEAATKKSSSEPELYIDDHGFLTQTKPPSLSSPEVYKRLPGTQNSVGFVRPSDSQRHPLRTLLLSEGHDLKSLTNQGLNRLHKRPTIPDLPSTQPGNDGKSSPKRLSQPAANAFSVMLQAARPLGGGAQRRLDKSHFVEQEAEESDEDETLGFGPRNKPNEEEEDGEDLDQMLTTLVDDQEMDETTVASQLVFEKFQEHQQADDQENEKKHQAAVRGELRKKRRGHAVGMDDSDEDSDEDESNQKIRKSMHKKQKVDRNNIKELGDHTETKAFYETYESDLVVDASDFNHLGGSQSQDMPMSDARQEQDVSDAKIREVITTEEFVRQVREVAQQPEKELLDPHDLSWLDDDASNDEGDLRVRPAALKAKKRKGEQRREIEQTDFDMDSEMHPSKPTIPEGNRNRMQSWANNEGRSRGGLARNARPAAVTHMTKSRGKPHRALASHVPVKEQRVLKAQPSVLASVAEERRTRRFKEADFS